MSGPFAPRPPDPLFTLYLYLSVPVPPPLSRRVPPRLSYPLRLCLLPCHRPPPTSSAPRPTHSRPEPSRPGPGTPTPEAETKARRPCPCVRPTSVEEVLLDGPSAGGVGGVNSVRDRIVTRESLLREVPGSFTCLYRERAGGSEDGRGPEEGPSDSSRIT